MRFLGQIGDFFRAYILKNISNQFTAWKLFKYRGLFWSVFSCICIEYRDLRIASRVQCRSGRPGLFCEEGVLKKICKIHKKTPDWRPATLIKKRTWHMCFTKICEIFENTNFIEQFLLAASGSQSRIISLHVSNLNKHHFLSKMKGSNCSSIFKHHLRPALLLW